MKPPKAQVRTEGQWHSDLGHPPPRLGDKRTAPVAGGFWAPDRGPPVLGPAPQPPSGRRPSLAQRHAAPLSLSQSASWEGWSLILPASLHRQEMSADELGGPRGRAQTSGAQGGQAENDGPPLRQPTLLLCPGTAGTVARAEKALNRGRGRLGVEKCWVLSPSGGAVLWALEEASQQRGFRKARISHSGW